ncbi:helix-turn-helix transcriptional regulator [Candidatus Fermentibacterales bacterium]|nr:helix-turn-helix transcriptional regulator [Candidatus Fermentibacterales bacterium]
MPRSHYRQPEHQPTAPAFGDEVGEARKDLGLTQDDLGRETGIDGSYVRRIENDGAIPSREKAEALAAALHSISRDQDALLSLAGYMRSQLVPIFWHCPHLIVGLIESMREFPLERLDKLNNAALRAREMFTWNITDPPRSLLQKDGDFAFFGQIASAIANARMNLRRRAREQAGDHGEGGETHACPD